MSVPKWVYQTEKRSFMTSKKYISQKQRRARKYVGKFQRKMKKEISTGLQNIVKQCNQ